jgi:hypothetical protein
MFDNYPATTSAIPNVSRNKQLCSLTTFVGSERAEAKKNHEIEAFMEMKSTYEPCEDVLGDAVVTVSPSKPRSRASRCSPCKWQAGLYNFLERPRGYKAIAYHIVM